MSAAEHRVAALAKRTRFFRLVSLAALIALIALTLLWELAIAPLRPGGSWMALKALPLLFAVRGTAAGDTYTFRWALMLVLAYFAEGCVRFYSDAPPSSSCALAEIALAATFFSSAIAYIRSSAATRLEGARARRGPA